MTNGDVILTLTREESLVLFDCLSNIDRAKSPPFSHPSEKKVLWKPVNSPKRVLVSTGKSALGADFFYQSVMDQVNALAPSIGFKEAMTLVTHPSFYLGATLSPSESASGGWEIILPNKLGAARSAPHCQMAVTTAHELYGHVLLGVSGRPWKHDDGGPVDNQTKVIEQRTVCSSGAQ